MARPLANERPRFSPQPGAMFTHVLKAESIRPPACDRAEPTCDRADTRSGRNRAASDAMGCMRVLNAGARLSLMLSPAFLTALLRRASPPAVPPLCSPTRCMAISPSSITAVRNACSRVRLLSALVNSSMRVRTRPALMPNVSRRGMDWFASNRANSSIALLASFPIAMPSCVAISARVAASWLVVARFMLTNLLVAAIRSKSATMPRVALRMSPSITSAVVPMLAARLLNVLRVASSLALLATRSAMACTDLTPMAATIAAPAAFATPPRLLRVLLALSLAVIITSSL